MAQASPARKTASPPAPAAVTVSGAPKGHDARLLADLVARKGAPVLHIARDDRAMAAMRAALGVFAPDLPVFTFPAWDCQPYDRISPNPVLLAERMATLAFLATRPRFPFVLLTTLNAATQRVPPRESVAEASFVAEVGRAIDEGALRAWLARMGYNRAPMVVEPGDFAIRGGIIDLWAPGAAGPVRLDFFGDILDGVRRFDPESQRTVEKLKRIELAPVSEIILDEAAIRRFRRRYRHEFGTGGEADPLYEAVSAGQKHPAMEHWLPFFHERLDTLFDHLPEGAFITLEEGLAARSLERWQMVNEQFHVRAEAMARKGRFDSPYKPVPPEALHLSPEEFESALGRFDRRIFAPRPLPPGPGIIDAGGRLGRDFAPERQGAEGGLFPALVAHVKARRREGHVVLAAWSEGARERIGHLLEDEGIADARPVPHLADLAPPPAGSPGEVLLVTWPLEHGFEAPGLTVISEEDIFGERLARTSRRRKRAEEALTEVAALSPGDLVVHVEHGIGRYLGLEKVTAAGAPHECLALEYAGGDRLYLPVENVELLSRYGEGEAPLDRLGSAAWQARKARMKERIRDIADKLLRIAAERALRQAPVLTPPPGAWADFCARFPWTETEDQQAAIEAVLEDMASGHPMDRLVCGDVGFGKTEVAMRAAFVAAMAGRQVALIAPTTLLARQHYRTFTERFRGFPVKIGHLSRFVSAKEQAAVKAGLADGTVDIVIGTHALLGKAVKFRDLALMIVDEEQHFGVTHKERLKEMRAELHALTLTATPIPRTLQMALSGVRDLSIISTPPVDRLAVRTYVSEFDTVTVREALLREKYRGGQSFFVVPRVEDIAEMEAFLAEQVPEVSVTVAHGQMPARELDRRMNAFYDGRSDVLLATSIIESGLDIPSANTLIVWRADMFGLAQLYQIRGRVGRGRIRAYAYLTTRPRQKLTPQAERRLQVLAALDGLGAGFTIAARDLDIRGAGNILGDEQSGHVREVGFELYQQMLEETIAKLRAGEIEGLPEAADDWSPQINLGVPVLIPEEYVPDLDLRLGLYRRLSTLERREEFESFAAEMIDRFGKLPREVKMLLNVVRIKAMAKRAHIARLDAGPKGATIRFHEDRFPHPAGLVEWLQRQKGLARVKGEKLIVRRDWSGEADRVKGAWAIAKDLAKIAAAAPSGREGGTKGRGGG